MDILEVLKGEIVIQVCLMLEVDWTMFEMYIMACRND